VRLFLKATENVGFRGFLDIDTQGAAQITKAENIVALADNLATMIGARPAAKDHVLALRPAVGADAHLLLAWRNDPESRHASRETEVVPWPVHEAWLSRALASSDCVLRIAEARGKPVGVVRADRSATGWELSWTVAPEARGQSVGRRMLQKFVAELDGRLTAVVRKDNAASATIAAAVGFTRVGPTDQVDFDLWARA
jgi:RimJ/RimL family protein N-acetyltransferase